MSSSTRDKYNPYSPGSSGWSLLRNEEFQEAHLWGKQIHDSYKYNSAAPISNSSIFSRRRPPSTTTAALMIPKPISSRSPPIKNEPNTIQQSSAPVSIPDWTKIYGKNPSGDSDGGGSSGGDNNNSWDDSDEDDEMMVPPHEWIARKLARSQISSFSVYEGMGRKLKGRDLSNVRNAVLTKTGFLE